ncbi:MAG: GNAT family N-acetyltransferase [Haliscomenobacter sp.]|nr:GNAT family N-acetyltransferase [Haliscomenobacter sp.]
MLPFTLRPWRLDDLDSLVRHADNPRIAGNLTNAFPHPYTREDGERFINMVKDHEPTRIFAIEINGEACGGIGIHPQQDIYAKNAEIGYWLSEDYWGQGVITRALEQIVPYAFAHLDITRLFARPFHTNIGSQRALEKAGFKLEARLAQTLFKHGVYYDELIYSILRER